MKIKEKMKYVVFKNKKKLFCERKKFVQLKEAKTRKRCMSEYLHFVSLILWKSHQPKRIVTIIAIALLQFLQII